MEIFSHFSSYDLNHGIGDVVILSTNTSPGMVYVFAISVLNRTSGRNIMKYHEIALYVDLK